MLQAGYLEDWDYNATLSGAPQGGVASPILSNIYLDQLDKFVETVLIPQYTRGENRKHNSTYVEVTTALKRARNRGDRTTARQLRKRQRSLPRGDPDDPHYRRLRYARYADDQLLGFTGPKAEAEQIKQRLRTFLHTTLKLELSQDKTLITHARTGAANFLGYQIIVQHADHRRAINGVVGLRVPTDVIKAKCAPYCKLGKPEARTPLVNNDDYAIVATYGAQYRGLVNYYLLAGDVSRLNWVRWVMYTSLLEDAGLQAPLVGIEDGGPLQDHHLHPVRATHVPASHRPTHRQETVDRHFRWHSPQTAAQRGPSRPQTNPGHHPP